MNSYIITASGRRVHIFRPKMSEIDFGDIAHSLAMQCRFNGHTPRFYSVAEHCCHVHDMMFDGPEDECRALAGLLHDAAEAYIGDIVTPLKRKLHASFSYAESCDMSIEMVERVLLMQIFQRARLYGGPAGWIGMVKAFDDMAMETEWADMFEWASAPGPVSGHRSFEPMFWGPEEAKAQFMKRLELHEVVISPSEACSVLGYNGL
jgi:hypothetical protein